MKLKNTKMVVFDLSGTTVEDDNAVAKCLYEAACEYGLNVDMEEFQKTIGTNKIHLYQFMIARNKGIKLGIEDLEKQHFDEYNHEAKIVFGRYSELMLDYYNNYTAAMPGAEEAFVWCKQNGIKVATDTGFHRDINDAIMNKLGWLKNSLIDISVHVEDTGGIGRPAPYMIYFAMQKLGIQSIHEVAKIGDTPADLLSGFNAGCNINIGVLSGANSHQTLAGYPHTHIIGSVLEIPELLGSI